MAKRLTISILSLLIVCLYQGIYAKANVLDVPKHLFCTELIVKDAIAKTSEEAESLAKKMIEDEADGQNYLILETIIKKQKNSYKVSVLAQITTIKSHNVLELIERLKDEDHITIPGSVHIIKVKDKIYCDIGTCSENEFRRIRSGIQTKKEKEITEKELEKCFNF